MENIPQPNYEIFIRNRNFDIEGVVKYYKRLEFRQVYNGVGGWILELASNTDAAILMKRLFRDVIGAYVGIIVTRDGKIVYSGMTRGFEQTGEYMGESDQENTTFFGIDDNGLLSMRLLMVPRIGTTTFVAPENQNWDIWRYPATDNTPQRVSSCIYTATADNISFTAPNDRNIKFLYIQKPAKLGPEAVVRGRYQNLLEKCQELSYFPGDVAYQDANPTYSGVQFRTLQLQNPFYVYNQNAPAAIINTPVPNNVSPPANQKQLKKVQFSITQPRNLRNSVVFSKGLKNLGSFRYKLSAPQTTYIVLGGQNNASTLDNPGHVPDPINLPDNNPRTRWFAHTGANSGRLNLITRYGLWESFLDRRDIQYGDGTANNPFPDPTGTALAQQYYAQMRVEMTQAMQTELIEKRELLEIEVTPINIRPTVWSVNYNVGDIVTVIIPGEEKTPWAAKVKEVTVTITQDKGEEINLVVGTETQPNGRDIFSKIFRVNKKANFLEELR